MQDRVEELLRELASIIDFCLPVAQDPEARERRAQLEAVNRTVADLERRGVSVPAEFSRLKEQLETELGGYDDIVGLLVKTAEALSRISTRLEPVVGKHRPPRRRRTSGQGDTSGGDPLVTGRKPETVRIGGESWPADVWAEVLVRAAEWLIASDYELPVGKVIGTRRVLVSESRDGMTQPRELSNGLWIETHYSARDILKRVGTLFTEAGLDADMVRVVTDTGQEV